jgi:hypothetical protein
VATVGGLAAALWPCDSSHALYHRLQWCLCVGGAVSPKRGSRPPSPNRALGPLWLALSDHPDVAYNDVCARYELLLGRSPADEEVQSVIERDLHRTFPKAPLFSVRPVASSRDVTWLSGCPHPRLHRQFVLSSAPFFAVVYVQTPEGKDRLRGLLHAYALEVRPRLCALRLTSLAVSAPALVLCPC